MEEMIITMVTAEGIITAATATAIIALTRVTDMVNVAMGADIIAPAMGVETGTTATKAGIIASDVKKMADGSNCSALINNYNGGVQ